MKKIIIFVVLFILFCCAGISHLNAEEMNVRPSTKTDLAGKWILVNLVLDPSIPKSSTDPWYSQYQIFEFTQEGKAKHMVSTKQITDEDLKIFELYPTSSNYGIDERGVMKLTDKEWIRPMYYVCSYVIADIDLPGGRKLPKGNLLLYSYGKNGNIIASYQLEKISK